MNCILMSQYGRPIARVIAPPPTVKSSIIIIGDLGFKPPGLRWNEKSTIITRQLQQQQHKQQRKKKIDSHDVVVASQQSQSQTSPFGTEASHTKSNI